MIDANIPEWIAKSLKDIERLTRDREAVLIQENAARRRGDEQVSKLKDYIKQVQERTAEQVGQAQREIDSIEGSIRDCRDEYRRIDVKIANLKDNIYTYIADAQQEVINSVRAGRSVSPIPLQVTFPAEPEKWKAASGMVEE